MMENVLPPAATDMQEEAAQEEASEKQRGDGVWGIPVRPSDMLQGTTSPPLG